MFDGLKRMFLITGTLVSVTWSRPSFRPSAPPRLPESAEKPLPSTDTNTLLRRSTQAQLNGKRKIWNTQIYAVAAALYQNLQHKEFLNEYKFYQKNDNRAVISEFLSAWNLTPGQQVSVDEETIDELERVFSGMMTGIRNQGDLTEEKEPFLRLLEYDMLNLSPKQASFTFEMKNLNEGTSPASQVIQIDSVVIELSQLYDEWIKNYQVKKNNPSMFVKKANGLLNRYFSELLKINFDETQVAATHWATPEIQEALVYYFDQRELLYRIFASTTAAPWTTEQIEEKISMMRLYVAYLVKMLARPEEYSKKLTIGPIVVNFGCDRMTKINAALEKYHSICALPFDLPKQGDPRIQTRIAAALENGSLSKIGTARYHSAS